jgi:hypothetical protein
MLLDRFDYLHNVVKMDHETMLQFPGVLTCRSFRVKQRHGYLCYLNRAQYDPKLPNYVSPLKLISDSDSNFAVHVAKASVQEFNDFCKTVWCYRFNNNNSDLKMAWLGLIFIANPFKQIKMAVEKINRDNEFYSCSFSQLQFLLQKFWRPVK